MDEELAYDIARHVVISSPRGGDPVEVVHGPHKGTRGVLVAVERNKATITVDGWRMSVPRPAVVVDVTRWDDGLEARVSAETGAR